MRVHRLSLLALVLLPYGCGPRTPNGSASARYLPAVPPADSASHTPARLRRRLQDQISSAADLPPLWAVRLPDRHQEIRISGGPPMARYSRQVYLQLVKWPTGESGRLMDWWYADSATLRRPPTNVSCPTGGELPICVLERPLPSSVTWSEVADTFDTLGAWTLERPCDGGELMTVADAGDLVIQRLSADDFSEYYCNAPGSRSGAAGDPAKAIYEYAVSLWRRAKQRRQ